MITSFVYRFNFSKLLILHEIQRVVRLKANVLKRTCSKTFSISIWNVPLNLTESKSWVRIRNLKTVLIVNMYPFWSKTDFLDEKTLQISNWITKGQNIETFNWFVLRMFLPSNINDVLSMAATKLWQSTIRRCHKEQDTLNIVPISLHCLLNS